MSTVLAVVAALLGDAGPAVEFDGPGWYQLALEGSETELTVRISHLKDGRFHLAHRGEFLEIPESRIKALRRSCRYLPAGQETRIRDSIELLADPDFQKAQEVCNSLKAVFPDCRGILHESLGHHRAEVRMWVVKLLGEVGDERDAKAVARALQDSDDQVRRAAVLAFRELGAIGLEAMLEYLRSETVADFRKAGVKTLESWGDGRVVPPLIALMRREKDPKVRQAIARTLKTFLRQDLGDNADAWSRYYEELGRLEDGAGKRD